MREMEDVEAEVEAMTAIAKQLPNLSPDGRMRVLDWARNVAAPVHDPYERLASLAHVLAELAEAVRVHKENTKQPRQVDKDLWDAFERIGVQLPEHGAAVRD